MFCPRRTCKVVLSLALTLVAVPATAAAEERMVAKSGVACDASRADVPTSIQATIDAAQSGDVIKVCPGVYDEVLTILKDVTVMSVEGPEETVLAPPPSWFSVWIEADGVTLGGSDAGSGDPLGFSIRVSQNAFPGGPGLVEAPGVGVYLPGPERVPPRDVTVEGNVITGFIEVGVSIGPGSHRARVVGNHLTQAPVPNANVVAIAVNNPVSGRNTDGVEIAGNTVDVPSAPSGDARGTGIGVWQPNSAGAGAKVVDNAISGHFETGIDLSVPSGSAGPRQGDVSGNTVSGAGSTYGIRLEPGDHGAISDIQLRDNDVAGVQSGIALEDGVEHSVVTGNTVATVPSLTGEPIRDPSTGGVYAYGKRNFFHSNVCEGEATTTPTCGVDKPPVPAALVTDGGVVEGIPEPIGATKASGFAIPNDHLRLALDSSTAGRELWAYGDWGEDSITFDTPGSNLVAVQARGGVDDAAGISQPAGFEVTVAPNASPTLIPVGDVTAQEDETSEIALAAEQPVDEASEEVELFVTEVDLGRGTLSGFDEDDGAVTPGESLVYTPDPGRNSDDGEGSDFFTWQACDAYGQCSDETVAIDVAPVNDAPVADPASGSGAEDAAEIAVELSASDPDGDALSYAVAEEPAHGAVSIENGVARYTPDEDFNGEDGFEFSVGDGGATDSERVDITVAPVNDAPVAKPSSASGPEDAGKIAVELGASDVDGDALSYAVETQPAHGAVSIEGGVARYTPAKDFNGEDGFEFSVADGSERATARATVAVAPVNDAPVAERASASGPEDAGEIAVELGASDVEGDAISYAVAAQPAHGTVSIAGGVAHYTPAKDFNGVDSFEFAASDGQASGRATVDVTVAPVNDAPVADSASATGREDADIAVELPAHDVDGDPLSYAVEAEPQHGTVSIEDGVARYTPAKDFNGEDGFEFSAGDGSATDRGRVDLTVAAVNDAPVAQAASVSGVEDAGEIVVELGASDVDGDALSYVVETEPAHGAVSIDGSVARYTPAKDFNGADSFEFGASDGQATGRAPVDVAVTPANDAPIADSPRARAPHGVETAIDLTGADVDGDALTYAVSRQPGHGTVTIDGRTARYTPLAGYTGEDSFTYAVSDPGGASAEGLVTVEVPPQPAPGTSARPGAEPSDPRGGPTTRELGLVVRAVRGRVLAGGSPLRGGIRLGGGTVIDASRGEVTIAAPRHAVGSATQTVSVSRGTFAVRTRRAAGDVVIVLRLVPGTGAAHSLAVSGDCRCELRSRDAVSSATGPARWRATQRARGTAIALRRGRITVQPRAAGCRPRTLSSRAPRTQVARRGC